MRTCPWRSPRRRCGIVPFRVLANVDRPEPLLPSRPTSSPGRMWEGISERARSAAPRYRKETPSRRIMVEEVSEGDGAQSSQSTGNRKSLANHRQMRSCQEAAKHEENEEGEDPCSDADSGGTRSKVKWKGRVHAHRDGYP